jgi:hypothetical protein
LEIRPEAFAQILSEELHRAELGQSRHQRDVDSWHIASIRGNAAIRSLSE